MTLLMKIFLCIDAALLAALLVLVIVKFCVKAKSKAKEEPVEDKTAESPVQNQDENVEQAEDAKDNEQPLVEEENTAEKQEEVKEEPVEEPANQTAEEVKEEQAPVEEKTEISEEVKETKTEEVEETKTEEVEEQTAVTENEIVIGDLEDPEDDREPVKKLAFYDKMLVAEDKNKEFFNGLYNCFKKYRDLNVRITTSCVTCRYDGKMVGKIALHGKTVKLYLSLDVNKFPVTVFFQKDVSALKAYQEVPFAVKVKSDRGLANAKKLIAAMAEEKGIVKKVRYTEVDSIALLATYSNEN